MVITLLGMMTQHEEGTRPMRSPTLHHLSLHHNLLVQR